MRHGAGPRAFLHRQDVSRAAHPQSSEVRIDPKLRIDVIEDETAAGDAVTLVACTGSVTAGQAERLHDQLDVQLRHGPRHVIVDLRQVAELSAEAARMLARYTRRGRGVLFVTPPGLLAAGCCFPDLVSALTSLTGAIEGDRWASDR